MLRHFQPSIWILLLGVLLSHLGTYMVLPILPIYLTNTKGITVSDLGLILAMSPITFQAGSMMGGVISDRIGRRSVIAIGALVNAAALAGYAWFSSRWSLIGVGLVSGLGVGLNAPSTKAAIALLASEGNRQTSAFAMRGIAANIGTALAGLLVYFVLGGATSTVFYTASVIYMILGAMNWLLLPKGCGDLPCELIPLRSYKTLLDNKPFLLFSFLNIIIWTIYTQFALSVPLRAEAMLPDPGIVSIIWTINSIVVILFQTPISRWFLERTNPLLALSLGVLFIGIGLGSVYWVYSFVGLIMSGVLFIVGEMLIVPTIDSATSKLGVSSMIGMYFGVANFVSGVGEGAGKYLGGLLLDQRNGWISSWIVYVAAAAIISSILLAVTRWKPIQAAFQGQVHDKYSSRTYTNVLDFILGKRKER